MPTENFEVDQSGPFLMQIDHINYHHNFNSFAIGTAGGCGTKLNKRMLYQEILGQRPVVTTVLLLMRQLF